MTAEQITAIRAYVRACVDAKVEERLYAIGLGNIELVGTLAEHAAEAENRMLAALNVKDYPT